MAMTPDSHAGGLGFKSRCRPTKKFGAQTPPYPASRLQRCVKGRRPSTRDDKKIYKGNRTLRSLPGKGGRSHLRRHLRSRLLCAPRICTGRRGRRPRSGRKSWGRPPGSSGSCDGLNTLIATKKISGPNAGQIFPKKNCERCFPVKKSNFKERIIANFTICTEIPWARQRPIFFS